MSRYRKAFASLAGAVVATVALVTAGHVTAEAWTAIASTWSATGLVFLFPNDPPVPGAAPPAA